MLLGVYKEGVCTLQDTERVIKCICVRNIDSIPVFMSILISWPLKTLFGAVNCDTFIAANINVFLLHAALYVRSNHNTG